LVSARVFLGGVSPRGGNDNQALCCSSRGRWLWAAEEAAGDLAHLEGCRSQKHPQEASWSAVVEGEEEVGQRSEGCWSTIEQNPCLESIFATSLVIATWK